MAGVTLRLMCSSTNHDDKHPNQSRKYVKGYFVQSGHCGGEGWASSAPVIWFADLIFPSRHAAESF
jgi:hypothetical protein